MKVILVTGGAGFIGSHLSRFLLQQGNIVLGIDCFTDYYDIKIKKRRVQELQTSFPDTFTFYELDLNEKEKVTEIFLTKKPEIVIHLAAQAGVGYCEQNPDEAKRNNIQATEVLLSIVDREDIPITHFLFASSSSIYGCHQRPWSEELEPQPEGIYGNSKKLGEEMLKQRIGKKYSITSMRFFTVYGQGGRPDMAIQKFTELIHKGEIVPIYGDGTAVRDYTYVDDIVQGITKAIENPRPYEAYNFGKGSDNPCSVIEVVRALESALNKKANVHFQEIRAGDVPATQANISKAQRLLGYNPGYSLQDGIRLSVPYFLRHYPTYPVLVLKNNNDESIRSVISQTFLPSLVILAQEPSAEAVESLKKSNIPFIHHSFDSLNNVSYWKKAFELVEGSFAQYSDFTPSTVFISFIDGNVPNDPAFVGRFIEPITKNGSEVIQLTGNGRVDFIRFDILRQFIRNVDDNQSVLEQLDAYSQNSENNIRYFNISN